MEREEARVVEVEEGMGDGARGLRVMSGRGLGE